MYIQHLDIHNVRNLRSVSIDLSKGFNFFYGANGAGKTALLEAVHLLCRGRSFRTPRFQSVISHEAEELLVRVSGRDQARGLVSIGVRKDRQGATELRINGSLERRVSETARLLPLQLMLPNIADLVYGGPSERRRWLDWGTFHVKHGYLVTLREYLKVLRHRNTLLKSGAPRRELSPWTSQLIDLAYAVDAERVKYLNVLLPYYQRTLGALTPELEMVCEYNCGWNRLLGFEKVLGENLDREVKSGATLAGPHRADVILKTGGALASIVLSRGQAKLVASALMISQAVLLAEEERRPTLFLIDDLGAELDLASGERLLGILRETGAQILATGAVLPPKSAAIIELFSNSAQRGIAERPPTEDTLVGDLASYEQLSAKPRMFHVKQGDVQAETSHGTTGD